MFFFIVLSLVKWIIVCIVLYVVNMFFSVLVLW